MRVIGLSLSLCVADIIECHINTDQVERLSTGTCARTDDEWEQLIHNYSQTYWRVDPIAALEIVNTLRESDRITQPRIHGLPAPNTCNGHWIIKEF